MSALIPPSNRYFVLNGNHGLWLIYREGTREPIQKLPRKLMAIETARTMAREHAPADVLVEGLDGWLEVKYSFGADYAAH